MRALLSVSDKRGLVEFARELVALGWEIVSTGGTAEALRREGITVIPIDQVTGFPEMMDGRVKTLHPNVHGGLLAKRDNHEHMAALKQHEITPIDLVAVNLYAFRETVAKPETTFDEAIEHLQREAVAVLGVEIAGLEFGSAVEGGFGFVVILLHHVDVADAQIRSGDGGIVGKDFLEQRQRDGVVARILGGGGFIEFLLLAFA